MNNFNLKGGEIMKRNNLIIGLIITLIIGGAVGFLGGMQYQKSQRPTFAGSQFRQDGTGNFPRGNGDTQAMRPVTGKILSTDNNSITVKMHDGNTKIVILSDSTSINKAATGIKADLKTGEAIAVFGTANSDGSVTAQSIQLNPTTFRGGGAMMGSTPK